MIHSQPKNKMRKPYEWLEEWETIFTLESGFTFIANLIEDGLHPSKCKTIDRKLSKMTQRVTFNHIRNVDVTYVTWLSFDLWSIFWDLGMSWDIIETYTRCLRIWYKILYLMLVYRILSDSRGLVSDLVSNWW